jgi:hypothetical protein
MSGDAKLLSLAEASKLMNKPEVTVKRYAKESLIRSVKENGEFFFPEDAVIKYIEIEKRLN